MREADENIAKLRDTLEFLPQSNIPAEYKRVLIELVEVALRAARAVVDLPAGKEVGIEWQPQEIQVLEEFLKGKVAANWQHADEQLMHLAGQLHRAPDDVKKKASELGLGVGVDYRQAKARANST